MYTNVKIPRGCGGEQTQEEFTLSGRLFFTTSTELWGETLGRFYLGGWRIAKLIVEKVWIPNPMSRLFPQMELKPFSTWEGAANSVTCHFQGSGVDPCCWEKGKKNPLSLGWGRKQYWTSGSCTSTRRCLLPLGDEQGNLSCIRPATVMRQTVFSTMKRDTNTEKSHHWSWGTILTSG